MLINSPRATNPRGALVPIVNLRITLFLDKVACGGKTMAVVVNASERIVGIVVDRAPGVMTLIPEQNKLAPIFGVTLPTEYLNCLGSLTDRMLSLVNIENYGLDKR